MSFDDLYDHQEWDQELWPVRAAWTGADVPPARLAYRARLSCWILRILCGAAGMPSYREAGNPRMGPVADVLDMPQLADPACAPKELQPILKQALDGLQAKMVDGDGPIPAAQACGMVNTIAWLANSAGLDPVERDLFEFTVAMRAFRALRLTVVTWGDMGMGDLAQAFSGILNRPVQEVTPALARDGRLFRCGLVGVNPHGDATLDRLFKVPRMLGQRIASHEGPPREILSNLVVPLIKPGLVLRDYHYMQLDTQVAQAWLAGALAEAAGETDDPGKRGAHLLVSGAPGLGKTEWVRALLTEFLPVTGEPSTPQAMEMVVLDEDGTALSGEDRLSHLRLTMNMLRHSRNGVIVFDEADDVFRGQDEAQSAGGDPAAARMANHRASLNRLIEDSRIPVIWIMNHPEILDPAVLRRFDTVIRFEGMPRSVRFAMLQERFGGSTEQAELVRWAEIASLTPALIDRLAVVSRRAGMAGQAMDDAQCRRWLRQRLPGKATAHLKAAASVVEPWNADAVHASEDLLAIAQGIGRCGSARLLLYGAPGTGKTAYAKALAQLLDKPLLEKRASDLLSPWVGETEQRINRAFEAAIADDAVLFIDEADSLLANREHAVRNWEVTQVNELLEQLSDFQGIVVLATNRLDALDDAVLRRMDAKIHFDVLTGNQLAASFVRMCEQAGVENMVVHKQAAAKLTGLTPGDFACFSRRLRFAPLTSKPNDCSDHGQADELLELLREELRMKTRGKQPMGFHGAASSAVNTSI